MRRKKILSLLLAMSMVGTMMVACGQAETGSEKNSSVAESSNPASSQPASSQASSDAAPADEVVTLTMVGVDNAKGADWNNTLSFAEYEKRLGIKFDATHYTTDQWASKLTLLFASDELPDILAMTNSKMSRADLEKYAEDGYFLDFSPYLDQMPNLKQIMEADEAYANAITMPDGSIYGFPTYNKRAASSKHGYYFMSQKWLENVEMERPESLDDLYNVLKAFKEQDANGNGDPNDEIPMGLAGQSSYGGEFAILWAHGIYAKNYTYNLQADDKGTVSLMDISENYKDFLKYMNKLYEEELINKDAYVISGDELQALAKEDKIGFSSTWTGRCVDYTYDTNEWYVEVGFTSDYSPERTVVLDTKLNTTYNMVVNAETEHPEAVVKFVDYLFTDEGAISGGNGYEGISFDMKEIAGIPVIDHTGYWEDKYENQDSYRITVATNNSGSTLMVANEGTIYAMLEQVDDETLRSDEVWAVASSNVLREEALRTEGLVIKDPFPNLYYTEEETKERATLVTDISNYLNTTKAQFITGELDIDADWEDHLKKLNEMGLEKLLEIEQAAYSRLTGK